ncbi:hypothetical protein F5Y19DRAFT_475213 [Xylariaceae sp. FL1651]|nr:hypothetical protein F5Y19DRAFT_475213 [Xylariaceae sp. FL1651]
MSILLCGNDYTSTLANDSIILPSSIGKVNKDSESVVSRVLDILVTESGIEYDKLADSIAFADLGIDSLMSLTVIGRIREELDLSVEPHAFDMYPTIGTFKVYLAQFETCGRKTSYDSKGEQG